MRFLCLLGALVAIVEGSTIFWKFGFTAINVTVNEGDGSLQVCAMVMDKPLGVGDASWKLVFVDNEATNGADYVNTGSGYLKPVSDGEGSCDTVPLIDDALIEFPETFNVEMFIYGDGLQQGDNMIVTIEDNESVGDLTLTTTTFSEDTIADQICLLYSEFTAGTNSMEVELSILTGTADLTDFDIPDLTFDLALDVAAGGLTGCNTINIVDDSLFELVESFGVTVVSTSLPFVDKVSTQVLKIQDNDVRSCGPPLTRLGQMISRMRGGPT